MAVRRRTKSKERELDLSFEPGCLPAPEPRNSIYQSFLVRGCSVVADLQSSPRKGVKFDRAPVKLSCRNVDTSNRNYCFPLFILGLAAISEGLRPSFIFGIVEAGFCCRFLNRRICGLTLRSLLNPCLLHVLAHPPKQVMLS
jgi:hypothetical protein